MRRRRVLGAVAVLLAGGTAAAVWLGPGNDATASGGASSDEGDPSTGSATSTAPVTRRDLVERTEVDGTLGYGDPSTISMAGMGGGTVTALPAEGSVVDRGQTIVEVDGLTVPLWFGTRPLWRVLDENAADGSDVAIVEENLVALGFATASQVTVDEDFTAATTAAVKRWQKSRGLEETGVVSPGDAIVAPGPVRITSHEVEVGGTAGGPLVKVTGVTQHVAVDLAADRQAELVAGQPVEIELPDGTVVPGTVSAVSKVVEAGESTGLPGESSDPTVAVTISLDDQAAAGGLDEAPVTVRIVTTAATDVLTVPVDALLALAEGGYAVEVAGRGTAGAPALVAVEIGAFADGFVEVTGDLAEGDEVVVPA